jgi:hypothetical protein
MNGPLSELGLLSNESVVLGISLKPILLHLLDVAEPSSLHGNVELCEQILHDLADSLFTHDARSVDPLE